MKPAPDTGPSDDIGAGPPRAGRQAWRLTERRLRWLAAGLVLAALAVALAVALVQRSERMDSEHQRSQLLARLLEDHASRSLESGALALLAVSDVVARSKVDDASATGALLQQTLVGLPLLRSLAVLDLQGRVLASSTPSEVRLQVDLARLGPPPRAEHEVAGPFVAARGLEGLALQSRAPPLPPGVGLVPMQRAVVNAAGQPRLVLALLNPDALANHQEQVLAGLHRTAALVAYDGTVLAATSQARAEPGRLLPTMPVFSEHLPGLESGSYVGVGMAGADQLVAWRALRHWPAVVIVEAAVSDALWGWRRDLRWIGGVALALALVILAATLLLQRSLRAREVAQAQRDQAQAEVALRERELSVIARSVQELLFRADAQGRLSFVNARWHLASGRPEREALGRRLAEVVLPESRATAEALFVTEGRDGVRDAVLHLGAGGGAVRQFSFAVTPLREAGHLVGFAGSALDVTERHQVEARLRAQLAFTELLLEVLPLPLSILDARSRYVSVNKAWEAFTGRRREVVVGQPVGHNLPAAEAALHAGHDARLLAEGGQVRYEASALHQDGSRRDLAITKAAVPGEDGRPAGILVAFLDVTEFRQAERATREARDAAEEASRSKTEFVANISHELRTPLQSIIGFSELGQMRSGTQARLGAMFGDIHAAGQRMLALVNDLLDVAKIESTVGTFHLERTDVRALVRDVLGELQPLMAARRLLLDLVLSEGPLVAKVDPTRFQQVVRNVVANAIRFSPLGEVLRVHGDIGPDYRIHITVSDRGPGIPPAELDKIFEAFVQSSKTKDGSGGTGLGLAISRKILQAHGGEIHASNNPEGGSTFHIVLPARGFADTTTGLG